MASSLQDVPDSISFPTEEEKIQEFWDKIDAFQTSLKLSEGRPNGATLNDYFFLPAIGFALPLRVRALVCVRWPRTGRPLR